MFLPYGDRFLPLGTKPAHAACYRILGGYPPVEVFLPYGGMAPLGRRPFPRMMPKEIACLFRRVIRRLSACRRVYILMGKRKAPFLCSEYGLHLLSVRRTNGVKDMEKASVYTGWNISPDLSDQRDRQGQFIWLRQLYLYSLLFFQLLKAVLPVYLQPPYEWSAHSVCTWMLLHVCEG